MSLVTRCPACTTTFKVVRDQLRISDGWVRCGRCSHVFDATLDLHESGETTGFAPLGAMPPAAEPPAARTPPPVAAARPRVVPVPSFVFDPEPAKASGFESLPPALPPPSPLHVAGSAAREPVFQFDPLPESPSSSQQPYSFSADSLQVTEGASEDAAFFGGDPAGSPERARAAPPPLPTGGIGAAATQPQLATSVAPAPVPAPAPAPASALSTNFLLPSHGLNADEPWSDLEVREPEWRPPASSLPPFPNIDLNLAPPAPAPPVPPLPSPPVARIPKPQSQVLVEPASDEAAEPDKAVVDDEPRKEERADVEGESEGGDKGQARMQKALRRARIKSAKVASAKAREEREGDASKAPTSVIQFESEPEVPFSPSFDELEDELRLADDELRGAKAASGARRPAMQRGLVVLCILAVVLLAVQLLRHERDGIVARQPSLRPALAALCEYTGCELSELRQISDIVIEGAAFAREKSGTNDYRLSFTLRNSATVPLAMPAIELSLLDTQERAVVRRVLMPADYGAPTVLAARGERAASLPLTLTAPEAAALPPVAGYRVEAFYP